MTRNAVLGASSTHRDSVPLSPDDPGNLQLTQFPRFGQRVRRRYASQLTLLPPGLPTRSFLVSVCESLQERGEDLGAALRITRQLVLERLLMLDCGAGASVREITGVMTELAEFALNKACSQVQELLDAQHGAPLSPDGGRSRLWVSG